MDRRSFIAALAGLSSAGLAGCLGDEGGDTPVGGATPTATPTGTPTGTPTEAESVGQREYPDYNWEALEGVDPEATTKITLRNTAFHPIVAAVPAGETVTFENNDSFGHTVTIPALDVDRDLDGNEATTVTVDEAGTYDYVCELHPPSMLGRLVVSEEASTPTPSPTEPEGTGTPTPSPTPTPTEDDGGYY